MKETQFYICLAVTLGLLLLVIPAIFLLRKRLPTIQNKIFFAQVWFASMVVVLMPLYYHFYKVAMYYSMCLFIFALSLGCAFLMLSKMIESQDFNITSSISLIKTYLLSLSIITIILMLLFVPEYLFHHALNSENLYDYGSYIFFLSILHSIVVLSVSFIFIFAFKTSILASLINIFLSLIVSLPLFFIGTATFEIYLYAYKFILILYPALTIMIPSINLLLIDKKNVIHKFITSSAIFFFFASIAYFLFHNAYQYTHIDKLPTYLSFGQFSIIGLLNLALIVPFLLMSFRIISQNQTLPAQINSETTHVS